MRLGRRFLSLVLLLAFSKTAFATFVGHQMEVYLHVPPSSFFGPGGTFWNTRFEVNDTLEVPQFGTFNQIAIDVSANNILMDWTKPEPGAGKTYTNLGFYVFEDFASTIPDIVNVTVNSATTDFLTSFDVSIPFDPSRITFDEDSITIEFSGLGADASSRLSLDVAFAMVPVPAGVLLFGSAIGLFALLRRKYGPAKQGQVERGGGDR